MNRTGAVFDVPRFTEWLGKVTGEPAEVTVTPMSGGASCEMFRVERLDRSWAVRRAPTAAVSDTAHQVVREARVIESLAGSAVPVPTILAIGDDPGILGAPFFVMSYVDGDVVRRNGLPEGLAARPQSHHAVGEGLIDTLVGLHEVDWRSTPLVELSHPEGFLARQVDRWMTQLQSYRSRDLGGVDDVAAWLATNQPARGDLTVMHGDYKLDNLMWSRQPPPRVVSVVDFEMTTVGDPLIDLAWALIFWPEDGNLIALAARETVADIESAGGRALSYQVDLTSSESRAALVDRVVADLGPIDVLVNNAATSAFIPFTDISEKRLRLITTLNYFAPFDLCQRVIPAMRERGGGWILNISSLSGDIPTAPPRTRSTTYRGRRTVRRRRP